MASVITVAIIEAAEILSAVSYTPDERAQMLDNLEGQIASARARRAFSLDNDMPAASRFDPRLATTTLPQPGPLRFTAVDVACPQDETDIAFAPLTHLSAWIARGSLTSHRLTEIYLRRIETLNPDLLCFATVVPERALAQADTADRHLAAGTYLGPLHGIPYGLKDLFDTAGIETGWGAEPFRGRVPERDAAIVTKLEAAGAVLLGKTTLGALAYGDIWYGGRTRNPWNLNEGASGSSAGSASATAAGLCGFSIGTETLGSITSPSQRCGTTGLRPTFGRVSRAGGMALCWSLDKVGPICRAAEDTAMVLGVLNGFDPADRSSLTAPFAFDAADPITGMRVGYLPNAFADGATTVDHAALETLRTLGLSVAEATLPELPYAALMNVLYAEAAAAFEDLTLSDRDDTLTWQEPGAWPNTFRKARFLSAVDHVQLDRLRYQVMLALDGLFEKFDILIGPFATGPMLVASNFTGHPCLHLRAGFLELATRGRASMGSGTLTTGEPNDTGPRFRVPQGISLWSRLFDEARLVTLGIALERALGVAAERPTFAC